MSLYNSVLTRRYRHTNSSTSMPLNATKIAVMKVSGVGVVRVGPELLFWINISIINVVFLAFFPREVETQSGLEPN